MWHKICLNLSFKCPQLLLFLHICGCLIPGDFRDALFAQKSRKAKMWHIWSDAHKITHYWETHLKIQTPSKSAAILHFSSSEKWEYHQWCLIMVPTSRRLPWASSQYAPSPNFPVMASGGKLSTLCLGRSDKIIPRKIFPIMFFCRTRVTVVCGYNSLEML